MVTTTQQILPMHTEPDSQPWLDWRTLDLAGKSAIEASAGTGKTYTLVLLVLRLLLERELPPGAILLATFTEAATLELRARVTERVRLAFYAALRPNDPRRIATPDSAMAATDPLALYLNARWQGESPRVKNNVRLRDEKILERAMLQMDDMPIRTLHGLCRQLLSSFDLVPGDLDAAIENGDALTEAALDDAFRRRFTDVKALPEAQRDSLDAAFLQHLRDGVRRVLKYGRITLRAPIIVDAQRYRKSRTALFQTEFRKALQAVLEQPPSEWLLRVGARRALENLLRSLKLGAQRPLPQASLALFLQPELAQFKKARRSILANPVLAQLCHFAQLHQAARRSEFASLLNDLVAEVRLRCSLALAARGGVSFDSMIETLAERLVPSITFAAGEFAAAESARRATVQLAHAIHQRYPVALIDEFQDTDAQQWAILQAIYGTRGGLILVGDPKQSIYRFRGSDVHTFVRATKSCERYFLQHNYRASAPLLAALNGFYAAVAQPFHSADIAYRAALVGRTHSDLTGAPVLAPLWDRKKPLRFVEVIDPQRRYSPIDACIRAACSDIKNLIQAHAVHAALPSIALLVSSNRHVQMAQEYLQTLGVPASASASLGVYQSEAAQVLQCVLCALAAPSDLMRARAARLALRLDPLDRVSALDERGLFRWVAGYSAQMLARGISFVCLSLVIERERGAPRGSDAQFANVQFINDANHLAELLAQEEQALLEAQPNLRQSSKSYAESMWQNLNAHIDQRERNAESIERRRIAAGTQVQVMTVHKAKGLEFDLVFLPTLCVANAPDSNVAIVPGANGLECDAGSADFENAIAIEADEALAELLRLQYVALTRAKQAVNVYFNAAAVKDKSALGWHLAQIVAIPDAAQKSERAQELAGDLAWEDQINAVPEPVELAIKPWRKALELIGAHENIGFSAQDIVEFETLPPLVSTAWPEPSPQAIAALPALRPNQRRISFSSLTQTEVKMVALDTDELLESDSPPPNLELAWEMLSTALDSPQADFTALNAQPEIVALEKFKGPNFGLALHALFEDALALSPKAFSDGAGLDTEQVLSRFKQFGLAADAESAHIILALLRRNLSTELVAAAPLAGLNAAHFVAELGFQLPVRGLDYRALAELGPRFGLPLLFLPEQALERVNGMLTGYIDLVFQQNGKFYLLDYKSNWLGASLQDYCGAALEAAMTQHDYHLQHILYALALHRYLQQSLADYDFETHFGGAHYLFVRAFGLALPGMTDAGHFQYRAPKALIEALDGIFSGLA